MPPRLRTFLVFESAQQVHQAAPDAHYESMGEVPPRLTTLIPYNCIGAIRAENEQAAVQAAMVATRRIGKYAVVEADVIKFEPGGNADGRNLELNA